MKKLIRLVSCMGIFFLMISLFASSVPTNAAAEFEIWAESPGITSGMTKAEMNVYKAINLNFLSVHKLSRINSNLWLTVCENKSSGSPSTSHLFVYLMLVSGENFVILYEDKTISTYNPGSKQNVMNLSSQLTDTTWYTSRGYEVPYYIMRPNNSTNSGDKGAEYYVVTQSGNIAKYRFDNYYPESLIFYNGLLCVRDDYQYKSSSSSTRWYDSTAKKYYTKICPFYVNSSGQAVKDTANATIEHLGTNYVLPAAHTVLTVANDVPITNPSWDSSKYQTFPDGRTIDYQWRRNDLSYVSSTLWFKIYYPDQTLKSNVSANHLEGIGSTPGYSKPIFIKVLNNTKFIISYPEVGDTGNNLFKEYYRVAVTEQGSDGETISSGGSIGKKNITTPISSDTVPINSQIDFGENDLPLGFNLNPNLKGDINSIVLPDVIVIKKSGYVSGTINTGRSIDGYSTNDSTMGTTINFTGNGNNLVWKCNYPENLNVGVYNKSYVLGEKTLYIKIKVVSKPTNSGTTAVTF